VIELLAKEQMMDKADLAAAGKKYQDTLMTLAFSSSILSATHLSECNVGAAEKEHRETQFCIWKMMHLERVLGELPDIPTDAGAEAAFKEVAALDQDSPGWVSFWEKHLLARAEAMLVFFRAAMMACGEGTRLTADSIVILLKLDADEQTHLAKLFGDPRISGPVCSCEAGAVIHDFGRLATCLKCLITFGMFSADLHKKVTIVYGRDALLEALRHFREAKAETVST
jgi:hypothetical protein